MEGATRRLARFLHAVEFDELPPPVVEQAKKCVLDFAGVVLAGVREPVCEKISRFFAPFAGPPESSAIRLRQRISSPFAALINGSVAHGLELDDGHILAHAHPGVTTIPAALAVAEKVGASGQDLLPAIVAGYEAVIRIGDAITPSALYGRGIHTSALVGTFGAATAAGKLLRLSELQMVHALGNCCLTPAASFQTFKEGAMVKDLYGGWPAFVGTMAALMAKEGITGPAELLEGSTGFCRNVSDDYDLEKVTSSFRQDWKIMGIYFKRHASCSLSHTAIDAALALVDSHALMPAEIEKVVVRTHRFASDLGERAPRTPSAAKTSIPFCIALALTERRVSLGEFDPGHLANPRILGLARKVNLELDRELDKIHASREDLRPSVVEIHCGDGSVLAERRDVARGWAVDPLSGSEFEEKFRQLAQASTSAERASRLFQLGGRIERLATITPFMEELIHDNRDV